jgi:hypothetical protein
MKATFAQLVDHFHLTPWDIERLTDRQIVELYFHPRTEQGEIEVVPDAKAVYESTVKPTLNSECFAVDVLVWQKVLTHEQGERAKAKIRAKYAGQPIPGDDEIPVSEAPKVIVGDAI